MQNATRTRCPCKRPSCLWSGTWRIQQEEQLLDAQANLAITYDQLGRFRRGPAEMRRDVYSGSLKFYGEEHENLHISQQLRERPLLV